MQLLFSQISLILKIHFSKLVILKYSSIKTYHLTLDLLANVVCAMRPNNADPPNLSGEPLA